jgi:hypothetical protein
VSVLNAWSFLPKGFVRSWLAPLAFSAGLVKCIAVANEHIPLRGWLVFEYLAIYALTLVFGCACLASGHVLLRLVSPRPLPVVEQLTFSFTLGVLVFYWLMSAAGHAMLYGATWFVLCPALCIAIGFRSAFRYGHRLLLHLRYARARARKPRSALRTLILVAGAVALLLFYFPIISPDHVGFDSAWYHVPIAEHYVADGGIGPFAEGWYCGTYPHLSSLLYTWALLAPGASFFFRVELAAHMEFLIIAFTLVGIPALAQRVARGRRNPLAWVACFLFPLTFFHDAALAADHIAALWVVPIFLALFRFFEAPSWRFGALLGAMLAGAVLVKYTAFPVIVWPVLVVAIWTLRELVRVARSHLTPRALFSASSAALAAALTAIVATVPHWLINLIFYGDPFYPVLHQYTNPHPWHEDASYLTDIYLSQVGTFPAERSLAGVLDTLRALFEFSFTAYEFPEYHGTVPYFGFLFTVCSLALPFLRPSRRLLLLVGGCYVTLFLWYWQSHVDRYLQAFLPLFACVVAVVLQSLWRLSFVARALASLAVAFQVFWGVGVIGLSFQVDKYRSALEVLGATYRSETSFKTRRFARWQNLGKAVPPDGKLLIHDAFLKMGTERKTASDWIGLQGGINYGRMRSPREVWSTFQEMGITHLTWTRSTSNDDSLAGDLRFFEFAELYAKEQRDIAGFWFARVPDLPPTDRKNDRVAIFACSLEGYSAGLYRQSALVIHYLDAKVDRRFPKPERALTKDNASDLLAKARFAATQNSCNLEAAALVRERFRLIGQRHGADLWVRSEP